MKKTAFALLVVPFLLLTGCNNKIRKVKLDAGELSGLTAGWVAERENVEYIFDRYFVENLSYGISFEIHNMSDKTINLKFSDTYLVDVTYNITYQTAAFRVPDEAGGDLPSTLNANKITVLPDEYAHGYCRVDLGAPKDGPLITFHTRINNIDFTIINFNNVRP